MSEASFHLFAYGTLCGRGGDGSALLSAAELLGPAEVGGALYDIDGEFPALMVYGDTPVHGEIWRCPLDLLPTLDAYEAIQDGLFRRVGIEANGLACWTYVAGPALGRRLTPDRRIASGRWQEREHAR